VIRGIEVIMSLETQIENHERRIAALEARQPSAHDTPETNPFMGRDPQSDPAAPPDPDFVDVFGSVRVDGKGRVLNRREENTWKRRMKSFGGLAPDPSSDAVDALLDHYMLAGVDLEPRSIFYGGDHALVFQASGMGYGTPHCYILGLKTVELSYGQALRVDRLVELIDQRRGKG
jgi:hypothetical protein